MISLNSQLFKTITQKLKQPPVLITIGILVLIGVVAYNILKIDGYFTYPHLQRNSQSFVRDLKLNNAKIYLATSECYATKTSGFYDGFSGYANTCNSHQTVVAIVPKDNATIMRYYDTLLAHKWHVNSVLIGESSEVADKKGRQQLMQAAQPDFKSASVDFGKDGISLRFSVESTDGVGSSEFGLGINYGFAQGELPWPSKDELLVTLIQSDNGYFKWNMLFKLPGF